MNIYLDVLGTLLTKRGEPAQHVVEFLEKVTSEHDAYWLTTYCRHGDAEPVRAILAGRLPKAALPFLAKIKPTEWNVLKTEAINFTTDFLWFDDAPNAPDIAKLAELNLLHRWIKIDLETNRDPRKRPFGRRGKQLAEVMRDVL